MGFVTAMATMSVVGVPGGGGSFEVVMSTVFATHGIKEATSIAAALLYRVVAFWLPVLLSLFFLLRLRHRKRDIQAQSAEAKKRARRESR